MAAIKCTHKHISSSVALHNGNLLHLLTEMLTPKLANNINSFSLKIIMISCTVNSRRDSHLSISIEFYIVDLKVYKSMLI